MDQRILIKQKYSKLSSETDIFKVIFLVKIILLIIAFLKALIYLNIRIKLFKIF